MPYEVTGVEAQSRSETEAGTALAVTVNVVPARDQFHVVHIAVFAPGAGASHRQYSQNIACPNGRGRATIPFALNEPAGTWRLVLKDTASGVTTERKVKVKPARQ